MRLKNLNVRRRGRFPFIATLCGKMKATSSGSGRLLVQPAGESNAINELGLPTPSSRGSELDSGHDKALVSGSVVRQGIKRAAAAIDFDSFFGTKHESADAERLRQHASVLLP